MSTILIVEDDEKITQVLKIRLKAAGFEVLTASDGVEGLKLARASRPDLMILDMYLSVGSGASVAYRIKEAGFDIPFIFLTASKEEGLRQKAFSLGAAAFFEKPYDFKELRAAIERTLKQKQSVATAPAPVKAPAVENAGKKVLIIEDDRKTALALAHRIRSAGYEATLAYDALTGVNTAVKLRPDLVLLDISMPGGNGFSVAERIQNLVPRLTPIIFLTASRQPGFRKKAGELGAAGYFEKPYDAQELLTTVKQVLEASPNLSA